MSRRVVIVGAGPAGMRAAEALVAAGLRPVVVDEGIRAGGQIYRRPPMGFVRQAETLYGADAGKARALHAMFDGLGDRIDYRPETLAWNLRDDRVHLVRDGVADAVVFDALILATGATDRVAPLPGWTLPGCYTLGGAQVALKAQGCAIGGAPAFIGTGPLLYLIAYQYLKAGVTPVALLDTAPFSRLLAALPKMAVRPGLVLRGVTYRARLMAAGVAVVNGVEPMAIDGDGEVAAVRYRVGDAERSLACDAVGIGYHLRSETQLADLAGCPFRFDADGGQWRPTSDADGRSPREGIYLAGDGARILGADGAEAGGRLAALAVLADFGLPVDPAEVAALRRRLARLDTFAGGLATAFPWPAELARRADDATIVCRCEAITAGQLRDTAGVTGAPEMNRAKALSRVGMGRCQGRYCGSAAAEILAEARALPLAEVGRLRGQAPVKPLSMATAKGER